MLEPKGPNVTTVHEVELSKSADGNPVAKSIEAAESPVATPEPSLQFGLPPELQSKQQMLDYTNLHKYGGDQRLYMKYTAFERAQYEPYHRTIGVTASPLDLYVAALRLYRNGFPFVAAKQLNIDAYQVSS